MTRDEKLQLIKDVKAGKLEKLHELREETEVSNRFKKYLFSCFHYLCENPSIYTTDERTKKEREPFKITMALLPELKEGWEEAVRHANLSQEGGKDAKWSHFTNNSLHAILEIFKNIELLHERNELNVLNPYNF